MKLLGWDRFLRNFAVIFHSLTIIISIWNMSSLVTFDFLELCPHLKS